MLIEVMQVMYKLLIRELAHCSLLRVVETVAVALETFSQAMMVCCSLISEN